MTKSIKSIIDYSGTHATVIGVECHITNGLPSLLIIGYAAKAVDEAKDRLRASFANSGLQMPKKRITINLTPADIPKDSTSLDLAMAVSILQSSGQIEAAAVNDTLFLGELNLNGELMPVRGLLGKLIGGQKSGFNKFIIPDSNSQQAALLKGMDIKLAKDLKQVYQAITGLITLDSAASTPQHSTSQNKSITDLSEIIGHPQAKRALQIAAAGRHNILLHGPPGTGKTMLARAMAGILPEMSYQEVLEVTQLHSLSSLDFDQIITQRPFRSPHHTSSTIALIGGGANPKPGEVTLAHKGVLFLDELPEFARNCLESLRQPLEDKTVTVARVKSSVEYPADFILVATQNPCPCGYYGSSKPCTCSLSSIIKYQKRISGPLLDRIDLHLAMHEVEHSKLLQSQNKPSESAIARQNVSRAVSLQLKRLGANRHNSSMTNAEIRSKAQLSSDAKQFIDSAAPKLDMSARAYIRCIKVARTIADLEDSNEITTQHIAEALQYRQMPTSNSLSA